MIPVTIYLQLLAIIFKFNYTESEFINRTNYGGFMNIKFFSKIVFIFFLAIFVYGELQSQPRVNVTYARIQQLSPSQIDFQNLKSSVWLFTINIAYPGTHSVHLKNCQINVILRDGQKIALVDGEGFGSEPFTVINNKVITNLDFGNEIIIKDFKLSDEGKKKIIEPALASGKFPTGLYSFVIKVADVDPAGGESDDIVELPLESYSQIELLYPRDGETTNEFPAFGWLFDGEEVEVTINEKPPGLSPEAALNKLPITYQNTFTGAQNSFQYPSAGVRQLQKGKTYVWKAVGKVKSLGGYQLVQSSIAEFKVADDSAPMKRSELLEQLERAVGSKWKKVFDKIRAQELDASSTFYLNGKPISNAELQEIIQFLNQNPENVTNVIMD